MVACLVTACAKDPPPRDPPGERTEPTAVAAADAPRPRNEAKPAAVAADSAAAASLGPRPAAQALVTDHPGDPAPARSGSDVPPVPGPRPPGSRIEKRAAPRPQAPSGADEGAPVPAASREGSPAPATPRAQALAAAAAPMLQAAASSPAPPRGSPADASPRDLRALPTSWTMAQVEGYMEQEIERGLGVACTFCHDERDYAAGHANKDVARAMIRMTRALNRQHFGGQNTITCFSCHKGKRKP